MSRSTRLRETLELDFGGDEAVPAILQRPLAPAPAPGVLLLHGFSSHKERIADTVGRRLAALGIVSLAIDLPLHGARAGADEVEDMWRRHPLALAQKWKLAIKEAHHSIKYLATLHEVDATRIALAGYSLGAYIGIVVAAADTLVRAVALTAGGDLPSDIPFGPIVRRLTGPLRAIRALNGRPLLMVNGRRDQTVAPAQAQALFDAAREPKELRWYQGGHWPPDAVFALVADWLAEQLLDVNEAHRGSA
jgi:dienelactone hydrolase